jgi:dynein heavy chain, axonemal
MRESQTLEAQIEEVRALYTPISTRGALLYFVIKDLALIDPMYQYSLQYTMRLFQSTLQASEQSSVLERRL